MKLNLKKEFFKDRTYELLTYGKFSIKAFRYESGVEALKIKNSRVSFIFLPFKGQQIWKFTVDGIDISMKTTIDEPVASSNYLKNYGGFLYHCGISAFGVPQPDDTHPQHGEIPNGIYDNAYIICDEDEKGKFIILGGNYKFDRAFIRKYTFTPECKIYEDGTVLYYDITLLNERDYPMEYMYLCHINFRPRNGAELIYSAKKDLEHVKLQHKIDESLPSDHKTRLDNYMKSIENDISVHHKIGNKDEIYDPEITFAIKYETDENGNAYSMQYEEGKGAEFVIHDAKALPVGIRWIARTKNEDSIGMVLPATSEQYGYNDSKRRGFIKTLGAKEALNFKIVTGYLDDADAKKMIEKIEKML